MTTQQDGLLELVRKALAEGVAIRAVNKLLPVEGEGGKIMPPTFSERQYAWEDRERGVILLDSVASHANRQEVLLGEDWQKLKLPILRLQFRDERRLLQEITSYQASHRVFDALFRDALVRDESSAQRRFRAPLRADVPEAAPPSSPSTETATAGGASEAASTPPRSARSRGRQAASRGQESAAVEVSEEGRMIEESSLEFATPLYKIGPHCLVYGCWDSTGSARGEGSKFSRTVESRVTGHNARLLQGTRGKLDAARLRSVPVYLTPTGDWTDDPGKAVLDEKQEPIRFRLKKKSKGVLSELNHSSVTPDIRDDKTKQPLAGGVTIDHAYQRWALSIPALRALSFPETKGGDVDEQRDTAARTVLALLALCGLSRLWDRGLWFRSGCTLAFHGEPQIEVVYGRGKEAEKFSITTEQVDKAYELAVAEADKHGLTMRTKPIDLDPAPNLLEAYRRSRSGAVPEDAEAEAGGEA
jgi:hypothetical protein